MSILLLALPWSRRQVTAVGFEPTPLRNGALSHRLRPLGQTVLFFDQLVTQKDRDKQSQVATWTKRACAHGTHDPHCAIEGSFAELQAQTELVGHKPLMERSSKHRPSWWGISHRWSGAPSADRDGGA